MEPLVSEKLSRLLGAYTSAFDANSWKGAGDPSSWESIEKRLVKARVKLLAYLEKLEAGYALYHGNQLPE